MKWLEHEIPETACHACRDSITRAAGPGADAPKDGAYVVCAGCGALNVYEAGQMRKPTADDEEQMPNGVRERASLAQVFVRDRVSR